MRKLPRLLKTSLVAVALFGIGLGATDCPSFYSYDGWEVVLLEPTLDLEFQLRTAFLTVRPGTIIELPAGTYPIRGRLISCSVT